VRAGPPLLSAVLERLERAGCVAPDEEAAELVEAAPDEHTLEAWVRRREQGEPPAWITGIHVFCGRPLHVDAGVFVPRHQTEDLARRAAALLPAGGRALDLCTGCGAVAAHLAAEVAGATVIGVDRELAAARSASRNGVAAVLGDLDGPVRRGAGFDLVTAVAPYVPTEDLRFLPHDVQRYEPRSALDGGRDGLDLVRRVVTAASALLRPGGWLLVEVGGAQDVALEPALAVDGFGQVSPWRDEDDDLRGLAAQLTRW